MRNSGYDPLEYEQLSLPDYRHIPGINARPDIRYLGSIAARASRVTTNVTSGDNIAWLYGVRLVHAGYFWEAHEVLETVWRNAIPNSRERFLVQSIIHIANARLKLSQNNPKAARRLAFMAAECLQRASLHGEEKLMGLAGGVVQREISRCHDPEHSVLLK